MKKAAPGYARRGLIILTGHSDPRRQIANGAERAEEKRRFAAKCRAISARG
jgi:hypothetical protein